MSDNTLLRALREMGARCGQAGGVWDGQNCDLRITGTPNPLESKAPLPGPPPKALEYARYMRELQAQQALSQMMDSDITGSPMTEDELSKLLPRSDQSMQEAGYRLGGIIKRLRMSKGGSALGALRTLAIKFQEALEMGDNALAGRISRQLELMEPGSSRRILDSLQGMEEKVANDKAGVL